VRRRRILVLTQEALVPPESLEGLSEQEVHHVAMEYDVVAGLQALGHEAWPLGVGDEVLPIRRAVEERKPDLAFNLVSLFRGVGLYESYIVSYLELLRCPYTGCNPRGLLLCADKVLAKKILAWHRIPTPRFTTVAPGRSPRGPRGVPFPLFVKAAAEDSSFGIAQASVVHDETALAERVAFVHEHTGGAAMVEEYVEGRELYVGVLGNERVTTFPIWEMRFTKLPEGAAAIATQRAKWDVRYQERVGIEYGPARNLPDGAEARIRRMAARLYHALGLSGYARVDVRLSEDGRINVLEANPNPDLSQDEPFALGAKKAGIEYLSLLQRIVNAGVRWARDWPSA